MYMLPIRNTDNTKLTRMADRGDGPARTELVRRFGESRTARQDYPMSVCDHGNTADCTVCP